ncbi:MAG: hypothetical protein IJV30_04695 [Oscillospiraceae bacterium]|nr:hypothetical protein [Oscillospiraceae bacterium]
MKAEKHKIWCQNDAKKYPYRNQNDDIMTTLEKQRETVRKEKREQGKRQNEKGDQVNPETGQKKPDE